MQVVCVKITLVFLCIKMGYKIPIRALIAVMIFFTAFTNYMLKANMSVSIAEMSKPSKGGKNASCPTKDIAKTDKTNKSIEELFDWNQKNQGDILSAYFYGTMVTFLPGGAMAEMLGAVNVIFYTSLASAILTGVTPQIAKAGGFGATFAVRFMVGVLGGPVYPAMNTLIAKWAPPAEKGKFLSCLLGSTIGIVITWLLVGYCTAIWGWEAGFYSVGVLMGLYCIIFIIITTDSPQKHRWISAEEREYIETCHQGTVSAEKAKKLPPYLRIVTSIRFLSTVVAQFGNLWALHLLLTYAPKYFKETLGFNLKASVGYAAMPYIAKLLCSQCFGIIGDYMRKKEVMSVTNIRKFFVIFSHLLPAACFCFLYLAGCQWGWVLFLLITSQAFNGAIVVGHLVNCQDLSPNFAGTLYGIMNWVGASTGFIVPQLNGVILTVYDHDRMLGSAIIFFIGAALSTFCAIVFMVLGTAEIQKFNYAHQGAPPQEQQTPQEPTT